LTGILAVVVTVPDNELERLFERQRTRASTANREMHYQTSRRVFRAHLSGCKDVNSALLCRKHHPASKRALPSPRSEAQGAGQLIKNSTSPPTPRQDLDDADKSILSENQLAP
jgi:hypothetical protein